MIYPSATRARRSAIGDTWSYALELEGRRVELEEGEVTLGRSRSCTVTLRDPSASRSHVLLTVHPGDLRARDLQSSNGTYVNGQRLTDERQLDDGDVITIGETEIVVRVQAPAVAAVDDGATMRLQDAKMACPFCSAELPVHADVCPNCGRRVAGGLDEVELGDIGPPAAAAPMVNVAAGTVSMPSTPPPASAAAVPPPPPLPPPMMAPPPASAPGPPPPAAATELYEAMPTPSPQRAEVTAELLPSLADQAFRAPGAAGAPAPPPAPAAPARPPGAPAAPAVPYPSPRQTAPAPPAYAAPAAAVSGGRPAGFWIRLLAVLIDSIWIGLLLFAIALPFGGVRSATGSLVASVLGLLLGILVPVLGWGFFGATPGKALLGLRVVGGKRRKGLGIGLALLRLCGMMVSGAVLGLGFLMVAFVRDKRALHDHLANTAVVRR